MTPREKAMAGFNQIKDAIAEHLAAVGSDTVYPIGRALGIHESMRLDVNGKPKHEGFVVYTALGHLIAEGRVTKNGKCYRLAE